MEEINENLTVEEIMERIRKKLEKRQEFVGEKKSESFGEMLRPENLINDLDKKEYKISDFLKYHDKEFIHFAYKAILKREPDPSGYDNYLSKLRSGKLDKIDIIVSICKSPEGRSKGVKVKNINYYYLRCGIKRIPILSYFISWINTLLKLPKRIKNLEIENKYFYGKISDYIEEIDNKIHAINLNLEKIQSRFNELWQLNNTNINNYHELSNRLEELSNKLDTNINNYHELSNRLKELGLTKEIPEILETTDESYLAKAVESSFIPYHDLKGNRNKDTFYYFFENIFRGQRRDIKNRQKNYLKYILSIISESDGELFLDAGCGRGEFLELLKENNIPYIGIDINELEINFLKERGFNVVKADILEYLSNTPHKFIGISSFQVIEHLEFDYIKKFIELAYNKIGHNGVIILESINPHCLYALSRFYLDTSHIRPYPPETIKFLLEWFGFKNVKIIFSAPVEERIRSKDLFMNYQDYAVIGKKLL